MALIQPENTDLIIDIPGTITIGNNEYKRKLKVLTLKFSPESKSVITEAEVKFLDLKDQPVTNSYIVKSYGVMMVADNGNYCDMQGQTICSVGDADNFTEVLEGQDYMMEFDWFFNVANTVPVVMNDMIKQFYLRAIEQNRFN